jgi:hypothetical protein
LIAGRSESHDHDEHEHDEHDEHDHDEHEHDEHDEHEHDEHDHDDEHHEDHEDESYEHGEYDDEHDHSESSHIDLHTDSKSSQQTLSDSAATKIQSIQRGRNVRKQVVTKKRRVGLRNQFENHVVTSHDAEHLGGKTADSPSLVPQDHPHRKQRHPHFWPRSGH